MGWDDGLSMQTTPFIAKLLEAKQPRIIMELKLSGSCTDARKQTASGERGSPQIVGTTTDHLWLALAQHSSVLSSFHGHDNRGHLW